jgi:hypothetical protein
VWLRPRQEQWLGKNEGSSEADTYSQHHQVQSRTRPEPCFARPDRHRHFLMIDLFLLAQIGFFTRYPQLYQTE